MTTRTLILLILIAAIGRCAAQDQPARWITVDPAGALTSGAVVYHTSFRLDSATKDAYFKFTCRTVDGSQGTHFRAWVNNIAGPEGSYWRDVQYMTVAKALHSGVNDIDIEVSWDETGAPGPILAKMVVDGTDKDGNAQSVIVRTDSSWVYYAGNYSLAAKTTPGRRSFPVVLTDPTGLALPDVPPKVCSSTVVGVTGLGLCATGAGSASLFSSVNDYSDKFYFLKAIGCPVIEDRIYGASIYQPSGEWFWGYEKQIVGSLDTAGFHLAVAPWAWVPAESYKRQKSPTLMRCVEHGEDGFALSPWTPQIDSVTSTMYSGMAEALDGAVQAVYPGIHGDLGYTEFPAGANHWLDPVPAHQHAGFWAGDDLARADFRKKMIQKYGTPAAVNGVWLTDFKTPEDIAYPKLDGTDTRRRVLDFVDWYHDSMTAYTARVCALARKQFPNAVVAPTIDCGSENPMHGQDISGLVAAAARLGIGVRAAVGRDDDLGLRYVSSACRLYGSRLEVEIRPDAGRLSLEQLFSVGNSGCSGLASTADQMLSCADLLASSRQNFRGDRSITNAAVFFPTSWHRTNLNQAWPPKLREAAAELRDYLDYDVVDERMILDDALRAYRVLVMLDGDFISQEAYDRINAWVDGGGTLVLRQEQLPLSNTAGSRLSISDLTPPAGSVDPFVAQNKGRVCIWPGTWDERDSLYQLICKAAGSVDAKKNGVYTSLFKNRLSIINTSDASVRIRGSITEETAKALGLTYKPELLTYSATVPAHGALTHFLDRPTANFTLECEDMVPGNRKDANPLEYVNRGGWGTLGRCVKLADKRFLTTTINVPAQAEYAVACLAENPGGARAGIEIDGKPVCDYKGTSGPHRFMYPVLAKVTLTAGKHALTLRASGVIMSDKLILTTDTDLAGFTYGFVDPKADQSW